MLVSLLAFLLYKLHFLLIGWFFRTFLDLEKNWADGEFPYSLPQPLSTIFLIIYFPDSGSHSGQHITVIFHVFLGSSWLRQLLRLFSFLMSLTVLRNTSPGILWNVPMLGFVWCFLINKLTLWIFSRNTTKVKFYFYLTKSSVLTIYILYDCWCWLWSLACILGFSTIQFLCFLLLFYTILFGKRSLCSLPLVGKYLYN